MAHFHDLGSQGRKGEGSESDLSDDAALVGRAVLSANAIQTSRYASEKGFAHFDVPFCHSESLN
jgi:hypothetical protein